MATQTRGGEVKFKREHVYKMIVKDAVFAFLTCMSMQATGIYSCEIFFILLDCFF